MPTTVAEGGCICGASRDAWDLSGPLLASPISCELLKAPCIFVAALQVVRKSKCNVGRAVQRDLDGPHRRPSSDAPRGRVRSPASSH